MKRNENIKTAWIFALITWFFVAAPVVAGTVAPSFQSNEYNGDPNGSCPATGTDNPIDVGSQNKFHEEELFRESGEGGLEFKLYYNSARHATFSAGSAIYGRWTHSYGQRLLLDDNAAPQFVEMIAEDGRSLFFASPGPFVDGLQTFQSVVVGDPTDGMFEAGFVNGKLMRYGDGRFLYRAPDGRTESYDDTGRLTQIVLPRGGHAHAVSYSYRDSLRTVMTVEHLQTGRSLKVMLYGHYELFEGEQAIRKAWMPKELWTPAGTSYSLDLGLLPDFSIAGGAAKVRQYRLDSIAWPNGSRTDFSYDAVVPAHFAATLLTGIDVYDAADVPMFVARYMYNGATGLAESSAHGLTDRALGQTVTLGTELPGHERTVASRLGHQTDYYFDRVHDDFVRLTRVTGAAMSAGNCVESDATYTYDGLGNRDVVTTDKLVSDYDYHTDADDANTVGLIDKVVYTDRVTGASQIVDYEWANDGTRLPISITRPGLSVALAYEFGRIKSRTETDTTTDPYGYVRSHGRTRSWSYDYTYHDGGHDGLHRVSKLTVTGPRNGKTVYRYDAAGNLYSVQDAEGNAYGFAGHDEHGLPQRMQDPNGVTTRLTYHPRGWLTGITTGAHSFSIDYDTRGQITRLEAPDGSSVSFVYTDGGRLESVRNHKGESITFARSAATGYEDLLVRTFTSEGQVRTSAWSRIDALGRFWKAFDVEGIGGRVLLEVNYDSDGNPSSLTDGNGGKIDQAFGAFGRIAGIIDRRDTQETHTVTTGFDPLDRIDSVQDQLGLTTTYHYDGFGNLLQEVSPDTGTTRYFYDDGGNVIERLTADGTRTRYQYDLLGRVRSVDYPNDPDLTYVYDLAEYAGLPVYGKGRLVAVVSSAGDRMARAYDRYGNVAIDARDIGAARYVTRYAYSPANDVTEIEYPSGHTIHYLRNAGEIREVRLDGAGQPLVAEVGHEPFGPLSGFVFGNGISAEYVYDGLGRFDRLVNADALALDYQYDDRGDIGYIDDLLDGAGRTQDFDYDAHGYLSYALGDYGRFDFTYDGMGNRETRNWSRGTDGFSETYALKPATHMLEAIASTGSGGRNSAFLHTPTGSIASDSGRALTYDYNDEGRLVAAHVGAIEVGRYDYNPLGQRDSKIAGGEERHFVYGLNGELLAEVLADGSWERDYIYLDGRLVAFIDTDEGGLANAKVYYVHADHLGTPQVVTDGTQDVVWEAAYQPFGEAGVVVATVENNLRFPGQYFDAETGLHYNYFRDYDPSTGRYIQSDPIGLAGGLNSYAYVLNDPINGFDPLGLATYSIGIGGSFQQTAAGASMSGNIGFDSSGQVCMQFTTCGRVGPGESAGAAVNFNVGEGNFCEGNSVSGGVFAEGGAGLFGGGSVDYGTSGASAGGGIDIGVGGGAAVGTQACVTRTWCF